MTGIPEERNVLSRDLSAFLVQFSIAIHKNTAYPAGHPLLISAVEAVTLRLNTLLKERSLLQLGVARTQLLIEGVATDAGNAVLRELAQRLHRQQLGGVRFSRGITQEELSDLLRTIGTGGGRNGEPLGAQAPADLERWPHVMLLPLAYDQLRLADDPLYERGGEAGTGTRAGRLWIGLAAAALATQDGGPPSDADAREVALAISKHRGEESYDKVIVGYLLQLGREIRHGDAGEVAGLQSQLSDLLRELKPETLARLLEASGDSAERRELLASLTQSMPVSAVLELLQAAATASQQTISHSLLRILAKLSAQAESGSMVIREDADQAMRDTVRQLLDGWTLTDPNPAAYTRMLEDLSRPSAVAGAPEDADASESSRIVKISLEIGSYGEAVWQATDQMVEDGMIGDLLALIEDRTVSPLIAEAFWFHLGTPDSVRRLLSNESKEPEAVDRIIGKMGLSAAEPMLDALEGAEARAIRRRLLTRLGRLGPAIGPMVVERLKNSPWFVQRNMLALLGSMVEWPPRFSPAPYAAHSDARVRREALKIMLRMPEFRDEAIVSGLADDDDQHVRMVLASAVERCPPAAVPRLMTLLNDRERDADLRSLGIRVLGRIRTDAIRDWLLGRTLAQRRWFRRHRLTPKSPELLSSLSVLARSWHSDPHAVEAIRLAASSADPEIRAAIGQRGSFA